jgi:hypothetical protein
MEKIKKHKNLCNELNEIYVKKNTAYGDSFGKTFRELGPISAITRMYDKFNRIISLTKGAKNDIIDESLRDSLIDLANYSLMFIIELEDAKTDNSIFNKDN